MILVDTGPIVALFDPRDGSHRETRRILGTIRSSLVTTVPVLTEVFDLLDPKSRGAEAVREFVTAGGMTIWFMSAASVARAFELMRKYADQAMDFADASLVAAAESLRATTVFTLDRKEFRTYRATLGRTPRDFTVLG
ncbi:MAG: type II toxin-antitoxin system VapC family toxin [Candidatus Binatia bacterium]